MDTTHSKPHELKPPNGRAGLYFFGIVLVLAVLGGTAYYVHASTNGLVATREAMQAEAVLGPRVVVAAVRQGPTSRTITLLGDAKPFVTTAVFAKISGYLKSVKVDKGDTVQAGQVVAEIDSPELESQFQAAVADMGYKEKLAVRARELLRTGSGPLQNAEQADSNLRVSQENVQNLNTMRAYQVLRAPFAGIVVARYADPGALMQAATTNQASSLPVMQISDNSTLRIGAYVEQRDVAAVHVGDEVEIVDASNSDRKRMAKISRTDGTLDPRTRTLLIEMDLDNHDGFLVPGSFTYANLHVPVASLPQVPVAALNQRGGVAQVAVVGDGNVVKFRNVRIGTTDGVVVNIADGVKAGEKVVLNVPVEVTDGMKVRISE